MSYTIESIAQMTGAKRIGNAPATIDWLLTDSRSLNFPETTLFFALHTQRNDGARYIPELYARGTRNFVLTAEAFARLQENHPNCTQAAEANYLLVTDPLKALQQLAELHRSQFDIPVIGITGSNGKTIVKEWLHQLLNPDWTIARSPRSYNSQIGVPLSVWQINSDTRLAIIEAGISEPGEMKPLQNIIKPTIGILTHIGSAHQENFASLQDKCMEKLALFKDCDVIIYNGDNEFVANCMAEAMLPAREIAWSTKDPERPLYISNIKKENDCTRIAYRYLDIENSFCLPFTDDASIENALNALAACLYLMLPPQKITERMARLEPVAMRLEVMEGTNNCLLINDSYNSDLTSLDIALDCLYRRSQNNPGMKRTLILSDILESGQPSATLYRQVARLMESRHVEKLIGVGPEISANADLFNVERTCFDTTADLLTAIGERRLTLKDEIILIKGARAFGFDNLTEVLEKKVHETILEVNLEAIVQNLNHYRAMLKPGVKMVCMIKASAYGAGAYEIAKTLQEHGVDYLAVAVADEGVELRKAGITANILIMNPEPTAFRTMFQYKLEPEVYSFGLLTTLLKEAEREGIAHFPIHIKVDTGMHRLGFRPDDMQQLATLLQQQDAFIVRSIFSHLAGSDSAQFDDFTRRQIDLFRQASEELQSAFTHKIIRHICNSAGIERFPDAQFDMVRLGLGLYGIDPADNHIMHNVSTLKTTILQIKDVPAGDTVGYSRRGLVARPSRIAALPIGYADGLNRRLGNGNAYCLVNGQRAPYIGNICMDVCMINVTDIDCHEGDTVEIFGDNLPITVLSDTLSTIPYEVLTSISGRVKRVYFI